MSSHPSRDFRALSEETFDVLVIGGGIHGAALAWESVTRGLKTALIERGDFGSGTTAGNFKTIHGGLRYLQHADLPRLFESAEEQRIWRRIAPHLVEPLPFLVPCSGLGMKSRGVLHLGTTIYELLTFWRNQGVLPERRLSDHEVLSVKATRELAPGLKIPNLSGGVIFFDALMRNSDRLTLSFHLSAREQGSQSWNYVELESFRKELRSKGARIVAAEVRDVLTGNRFEIKARQFINATGPWWRKIANLATEDPAPEKSPVIFSKGLQVVLPRIVSAAALALESDHRDESTLVARGKRSYFLIPWREHSILGTADILHTRDPDAFSLESNEVEQFLDEVKGCYDSELLDTSHVRAVFGGLRPVSPEFEERYKKGGASNAGSIDVARRDRVVDHANENELHSVENLISVEGIKYTTTRRVAEQVLDYLNKARSLGADRSRSALLPLVGGNIESLRELRAEAEIDDRITTETLRIHLAREYGTRHRRLRDLIAKEPRLGLELSKEMLCCGAEVVHAIREENACRLDDVVMRRMPLGSTGYPSDTLLSSISTIMAQECGWSDTFRQSELERVRRLFPKLS